MHPTTLVWQGKHDRALHHLNYIGNYDYYLDKKDAMEQAHLQTETKVSDVTASATATASDTKLSWQQQKEEQARQRKLEKELQAVETEIEELESDNEQIDTELSDPANGNDVAKEIPLDE